MEPDNVNTFHPCSFGTRTINYNRFIIHLLTTFEGQIALGLFAWSIRGDLRQFDPELTINKTILSNSNAVGKVKKDGNTNIKMLFLSSSEST